MTDLERCPHCYGKPMFSIMQESADGDGQIKRAWIKCPHHRGPCIEAVGPDSPKVVSEKWNDYTNLFVAA